MKKYAKKKYITGGYTPVGIIPPSVIKENKESNDTFGSQFLKAMQFTAPIAGAMFTGGASLIPSLLKQTTKMNSGGQLPNGAVKIKGAKDQKLNDSATLIKGNPNKTDGNQYLVNGQRIHLDNNEVVKGNMVVSDSVINPATGNSFAKDVTDIERQIGKASKDTSLEGRNTLKHLSNRTKSLIQQQEMITGRSNGTHFQKGGPIDPNWQTAGDLKFDSNKARIENGYIYVIDVNTGKERKVLRNNDGSYRKITWADTQDKQLRNDNYPVDVIKKLANNPEVDFKPQIKIAGIQVGPKEGRTHYEPSDNSIHLMDRQDSETDKKSYISELTHAIQKNTTKDLTTVNVIEDWLRNPFITNEGQHKQYDDANSFEFRAHSQVEPIIYNSKGRQGLNPVKISGKNLKTSITDTDVSWTNEDGTLNTMVGKNIVKLKRNPDGTYNTLDNRPMNSEEYIRFSNINANLRKSKDKQLNPKDEFDLQAASDRLANQKEHVNMRLDKGGPIEPNIQTVGNIKFDSNKSRRAEEGHMIVNDMTSKKDYGVVRNTDGSYRFYDQSKDKPMSEEQNIKKYYSDFISSKQYDKINGEKSLQEVATLPNDIERSLALERRKAFDNLKSSQIKAVTTTPVVLSNDIGSAYLNNTAKDKNFYSAHPKVSYSDKQAAELKATKEEILAHEYSHVKDDPNYKDYRFSKTDFRFHDNAKDKSPRTSVQEYTKNTTNRHDSHAWEYKADVNATRYLLLKEGIYDPLNEPFTKEHLDKVKNSSIKNKFMVKRLLENSKDENSVIKALNEISAKQSTSSNTQYAKYGGPIQAFDKGGPLPKGLNVKDFQEWAIKNGATIKADGAWGPQTEALYTQYKDAYGLKDHTYDYNELADLTDRMDYLNQKENGTAPALVDAKAQAEDNRRMANEYTWKQPLPTSGTNIANQSTLPNLSKYRIQPETEGANITMSKLGALPDLFNMDGASETPPGIVENPIVTPEEQKKQEAAARFKALGAKSGDALQAASVVSQMFRAHQKPKLEKRYNVNAPITKESFDVTNPLQQSNRTFKNMVSGIDAGSVNTKRAVANSMYANRLSNDSNTIQQYDVMNQGARSNYEQKLAQRQAQNIQLSQYTDDLDQRNLGAYNNAKDVAWNSVNNFGKAINDKKSAYANLEMLKKIYSDVAKNIK